MQGINQYIIEVAKEVQERLNKHTKVFEVDMAADKIIIVIPNNYSVREYAPSLFDVVNEVVYGEPDIFNNITLVVKNQKDRLESTILASASYAAVLSRKLQKLFPRYRFQYSGVVITVEVPIMANKKTELLFEEVKQQIISKIGETGMYSDEKITFEVFNPYNWLKNRSFEI